MRQSEYKLKMNLRLQLLGEPPEVRPDSTEESGHTARAAKGKPRDPGADSRLGWPTYKKEGHLQPPGPATRRLVWSEEWPAHWQGPDSDSDPGPGGTLHLEH